MAFDRRNNRMRMHGGNPRETTWARSVNVFALAANGNYSTLDLLGPFKTSGGVQQGVTVIRTHLAWSVTTAVAAADSFSWATGRGQVADQGANIAGAPVPDTNQYSDWNMWRFEVAASSAGAGPTYWRNANQTEFDIKSARRLPELQMSYNLVIKRQTVAAATLGITVIASVLLKLP
jgi:hypothetical protein